MPRAFSSISSAFLFIALVAGCGQRYDPDELAKGILSEDENKRAAASQRLVEVGDDMVERLISILRDEKQRPRHKDIAEIFAKMQEAGTLKDFKANKVAGVLGDVMRHKLTDGETKIRIAQILGDIPAPTAIRPLIAVLGWDDEELAAASMASLAKLGPLAAAPLVAVRDSQETPPSKVEAVNRALEELSKGLADDLASEDADKRLNAVRQLGSIGSAATRQSVAALCRDPEAKVRLAVVQALSVEPTDAERDLLAQAASDEDEGVLIEAVSVLAEVEDQRAVQFLAAADKLSDVKARVRAIGAIAKLKDEKLLAPLRTILLEDAEVKARRAAALALEEIAHEAGRASMLEAIQVEDQDAEVLLVCARALGKLGEQKGVEKLIELLVSKVSAIRIPAIEALGHVGGPAIAALLKCLDDPSPARQACACLALAAIKSPDTVEALVALVSRPVPETTERTPEEEEEATDLFVRGEEPHIAAIQALAAIGDARAVKPLVALLSARPKRVREYAEWALTGFGQSAAQELVDRLSSPKSWLLEPREIVDPSVLGQRLHLSEDPLGEFFLSRLSRNTLDALKAMDSEAVAPESLAKLLCEDLNGIIKGDSIYSDEVFAEVHVPRELRALGEGQLQDENLRRLHRLLIERAYPDGIAPNPHERTAEASARIICRTIGAAAVEALTPLLNEPALLFAPKAALEAANGLAHLAEGGSPLNTEAVARVQAIGAAPPALEDRALEKHLRSACIRTLGHAGRASFLPELVELLTTESDPELRYAATRAIAAIASGPGEDNPAEPLSELDILKRVAVRDEELTSGVESLANVQRQALLRLGELGHIQAIPAVTQVLKASQLGDAVYEAAALAYLRITGRKFDKGR